MTALLTDAQLAEREAARRLAERGPSPGWDEFLNCAILQEEALLARLREAERLLIKAQQLLHNETADEVDCDEAIDAHFATVRGEGKPC